MVRPNKNSIVPILEKLKNQKDLWKVEKYSPRKGAEYFRYRKQDESRQVIYIGNKKKYEMVLEKLGQLEKA